MPQLPQLVFSLRVALPVYQTTSTVSLNLKYSTLPGEQSESSSTRAHISVRPSYVGATMIFRLGTTGCWGPSVASMAFIPSLLGESRQVRTKQDGFGAIKILWRIWLNFLYFPSNGLMCFGKWQKGVRWRRQNVGIMLGRSPQRQVAQLPCFCRKRQCLKEMMMSWRLHWNE
jgi:hypothetical protein